MTSPGFLKTDNPGLCHAISYDYCSKAQQGHLDELSESEKTFSMGHEMVFQMIVGGKNFKIASQRKKKVYALSESLHVNLHYVFAHSNLLDIAVDVKCDA